MHFVVDNVAGLAEINRINDFIVSIILITIEILRLATVTYSRVRMWFKP